MTDVKVEEILKGFYAGTLATLTDIRAHRLNDNFPAWQCVS